MKKLEKDRLTIQLMAGQENFPAETVRSSLQDVRDLEAIDGAQEALQASRRQTLSDLGVTGLLDLLTVAAEQDGSPLAIPGRDPTGDSAGWALYEGGNRCGSLA